MKQKTYLRENLIEIAFTEFKKNNPHCPEDLSKKYATSKVDILLGYEKEEERTTVTPEPKQEIEFITAEEDTKEKIKVVTVGILKWETIPKKNSKWSLIYENRVIHQVAIKDSDFLKRILDEKLRFGAGDSLTVDLLVKLKKDEYSGMFLENKFEILKVHDIKWRGEQVSLF